MGQRARAVLIAGALATGLVVAGCGDADGPVPDAGAATAPAATTAATTAPAAATAPAANRPRGAGVVRRRVGTPGRDGALTFTVRRLAASPPIDIPFARPLRAPAGRRLIVATVVVRNHVRAVADPFCGGGGALLVDRRGRQYEPHPRIYAIPGNRTCHGIGPLRRSTETLAFVIPAGARPAALRLWDNRQVADFLGEGHVRVGR